MDKLLFHFNAHPNHNPGTITLVPVCLTAAQILYVCLNAVVVCGTLITDQQGCDGAESYLYAGETQTVTNDTSKVRLFWLVDTAGSFIYYSI